MLYISNRFPIVFHSIHPKSDMCESRSTVSSAQLPGESTSFTGESADCPLPHPPTEPFSIFGELQNDARAIPTPAEQNVPTLYDEFGRPLFELKKINQQILLSFQKLVGIVAAGSESPHDCMEHIGHLFVNANCLLNGLRPLQEYENMRHFLTEQNRELEEFKQEFGATIAQIANLKPP
jgi:hypothetical protein